MALDLLSSVNDAYRRDFPTSLDLDPTVAGVLEAGEWVAFNASNKLIRVAAVTEAQAYQVFTQKGDYAAQALGKLSVLFLGEYEFETDMFASGSYAPGDELTIVTAALDGQDRALLDEAAATNMVHAIVTMGDGSTPSGKLRARRISPYQKN
jgi:hypothetical protein